MDKQKSQALFKWVEILLDRKKVNKFQLFDDGVMLLDILKLIDKDSWTDEFTDDPSGRLECIFTYLEGLYKDLRDAISKTAVLAGNHFETAKLLTVILVAAVNSENVQRFVEPIMSLSKASQLNLMCLISLINERPPDGDLGELLHEALCSPVTAEESLLAKSPSSFICSPGYSYSPYTSFVGSPAVNGRVRNTSQSSSLAADSPFRIIGSPRIVDRKELFEKNKLNVRIRRLNSSLATQHHVIDELESRLEDSKKKNEVLESMNKDLNARIKSLLGLEDEVSSLRMMKVELDTKENIIERISEKLAKALEEQSFLSVEVSSLKTQFEAQLQEKTEKLDCIRKEVGKLESSENALKIKNAELCDSIQVKDEEFQRIVSEKDQQCKELLDHIGFLKEKFSHSEEPNNQEDAFVVIGDDQKCLKSEIYVVTLEEDLKKANEELNLSKEKHESARKLILELKNDLNENKLVNLSMGKELDAKDAALCELQNAFEESKQGAKEREGKLLQKVSAQELAITEAETKMSMIKDTSDSLKREKEELQVKSEQEKGRLTRLLHDEQIKLQSTQLEVTNMKAAKDELERLCKEQSCEFAKKLERMEEQHEVDCYKLNEDFQKKISILERGISEKEAALAKAQEAHSHLLKSKKADDEIFLARISALVEERERAISSVRNEMDKRIGEAAKERALLENECKRTQEEKSQTEAANLGLQENLEQTKAELQEFECQLEKSQLICEERSALVTDLEKKVKESRATINACNVEIDCLTLKHQTELEKALDLRSQNDTLEEQIKMAAAESRLCVEKFEKMVDSLKTEKAELIREAEVMRTDFDVRNTEFYELERSSDALQSQLNEKIAILANDLEAIREEKVSLITQVDVVKKELETVNVEHEKLVESSAADLSKHKQEIEDLKDVMAKVEESNKELKEELSGAFEVLQERTAEVSKHKQEIEDLKDVMAKVEESNRELKEEVSGAFEVLQERTAEVSKHKQEIEDLKEEMAKVEESNKELKEEVSGAFEVLQERTAEVSKHKQEIENLKDVMAKVEESNKELKEEVSGAFEVLQERTADLSKHKQEIEDLKDVMAKVEESNRELKEEHSGAFEVLQERTAEVSKHKQEIEDLKEEMAKVEESNRELKEELSGAFEVLQERTAEVSKLAGEKSELSSVIERTVADGKAEMLRFEEKRNEELEVQRKGAVEMKEVMEALIVECEERVNTVCSELDSVKVERDGLVQQLTDVGRVLEEEKIRSGRVEKEMSCAISSLEEEITEVKKDRSSMEMELKQQLDEVKRVIEAKEVEHAGIVKEFTLKISQRQVEIESLQGSSNIEKDDLRKECRKLRDALEDSRRSLKSACGEVETKDENCASLKREIDEISLKMKQDAKELAENFATERKTLEDQIRTEKESVKVFGVKLEELQRCLDEEKNYAARVKLEFEKQNMENEGRVKSLAEALDQERDDFCNERESLKREIGVLTSTLNEEKEVNEAKVKELEFTIVNITKENDEKLKEIVEKAGCEKDELLERNRKLICDMDIEMQKVVDATNQLELEKSAKIELEKELNLIISQKEEEIIRQLDVQKCDKEAFEVAKSQLEVELKSMTGKAAAVEDRVKEEILHVEDMKAKMNMLVENSGEEVKCLIAKHEAEKNKIVNDFDAVKGELKQVKSELQVTTDLLRVEKENSSALSLRVNDVISEKNAEISKIETRRESDRKAVEEKLRCSEKAREAAEESLSGTKALLEAEKEKSDHLAKEHQEVCDSHEHEKKEIILRFESEKQNFEGQIERLEREASDLRNGLETVSAELDGERRRAEQVMAEKEKVLRCHHEEVQQFQEELQFAREHSEELCTKSLEEKTKRDNLMKDLQCELNAKVAEHAKEREEFLSRLETAGRETTSLQEEAQDLAKKCKDLTAQCELKAQEAKEKEERILELDEKINSIQTQYDTDQTSKKELKTMVDAREEEYQLAITKYKEEVTTCENRIATIETESRQAVSDLQQKLEGTARERNQIEAEKIDYQLRLVEAEKANYAMEKSIDALKEKMKENVLRKEAAFAKEKEDIQTLAECASKEVKEKNEQLQEFQSKIKAMESELELTKSKLQTTEAELKKKVGSMAEEETAGERVKSARSRRRQTMLPCDFDSIGNDSTVGLEDQSTLICDDLTLKRSPSVRSLDMDEEEQFGGSITSLESIDSIRSTFSRTRSLRRQSGVSFGNPRRKSLLYMAGRTPPERRTTLCIPVPQMPACQMEDEPDILEDKCLMSAFGQTAMPNNFESDFDRMSELKRRNTLCLPHLKSSYPLEVIEAKDISKAKDAEYEATVRNGLNDSTLTELNSSRKRFSNENGAGQQAKQKRLETASFANSTTRHIKSDSNISSRSTARQGPDAFWGDVSRIKEESLHDVTSDPRRESVAFTLAFDEPNKKMRPPNRNVVKHLSKEKPSSAAAKDNSTRHVKSDSNISTRSMIQQGTEMIWGDGSRIKEESDLDATSDPRRESVAFTLCFDEPNKKLKPRASMRRSRGSSHLINGASTESLYASQESIAARQPVKLLPAKDKEKSMRKLIGKENKGETAQKGSVATPLKRSQSDKTTLKSRTSSLRKSIRKSISSKVRGAKAAL